MILWGWTILNKDSVRFFVLLALSQVKTCQMVGRMPPRLGGKCSHCIVNQSSSFYATRWLHSLFLAIDANFRLKRKAVSRDDADPTLSRGWAYFVEDAAYKSHLEVHGSKVQEVICTSLMAFFAASNYSHRKVHVQATTLSTWPTLRLHEV
jgi:hypothetical protein